MVADQLEQAFAPWIAERDDVAVEQIRWSRHYLRRELAPAVQLDELHLQPWKLASEFLSDGSSFSAWWAVRRDIDLKEHLPLSLRRTWEFVGNSGYIRARCLMAKLRLPSATAPELGSRRRRRSTNEPSQEADARSAAFRRGWLGTRQMRVDHAEHLLPGVEARQLLDCLATHE